MKKKKDEITIRSSAAEYLTYVASVGDQQDSIEMRYEDENIWLTQKMMATLYDVGTNTINYHIKKIFEDSELQENSVIRKFRITAADGKTYTTNHYSLEMIIAVGFKVNSERAVQFRKWVNQIAKDYTIKGWVMDDERLKNSGSVLTTEYFDRLLEQIREIRLSERRFYQKITDNGDAGTGKTVLLTHLVASILKDRPGSKIGVVVQPNWEKTGANIFKVYGMNSSYLSVTTSTKIITEKSKYDVIIIDESHKLSRRYGKQHPSFGEVYNIPEYEDCESHLEILQRMGQQIILMYDVLQAIRPANVTRDMFKQLTAGYEKRFLQTQFRIHAPKEKSYTSDDYVNGIKYLLFKDTGLLDSKLTNFNPDFNRDVFRDKSADAYFGYVAGKPMHQLFDWVEEDRNFNPEHINRVLSGMFCCATVDKWAQSHGKDASITHFHEDGLNRRWNSTQENWININDDDAEDQIGSVFAVQGIDLNKVGVIIGPDIKVNANGKLEAVPDNHNNINNKFSAEEMELPSNQFEFTLFILNQYYVLLTRGIDGIRLGFWNGDNSLRKYLEETLKITAI